MKRRAGVVVLAVLSCSTVHSQFAQGPASGFSLGGVLLTTDAFPSAGPGPAQGKVFRSFPNRDRPVVALPANAPLPAGPEGSNVLVYDPHADGPPPVTVASFDGIPMTNAIPPDPHFAVGPSHAMQTVNNDFRISDKEGRTLKTIDGDYWYSLVVANMGVLTDPKVLYDHYARRWVMVWITVNDATLTSYYLLSVSDDDNPLGAWWNFVLPSNVNGNTPSGNWADYQGVGFDSVAYYLTSNQFTFESNYAGAKVRIVPKAQCLRAMPDTIRWTDFWNIRDATGQDAFGIRPAIMMTHSLEYYFANIPGNNPGTYVAVWRLSNPISAPVLTPTSIPVVQWSTPPNASQLGGGSLTFESGGARLRNEPVFRDSSLWLVHSVRFATNYSAIRYVRINTVTNTAIEDGALGAPGYWHIYPAIMVDKDRNLAITCSRSATSEYMGAYFTWRLSSDPPGALRPAEVMQAGRGNYVVDYGSGRNRWGDYLGIALDPLDRNTFWMYSEYVPSTNRWGTWVHAMRAIPYPGARVSFSSRAHDFGLVESETVSGTLPVLAMLS